MHWDTLVIFGAAASLAGLTVMFEDAPVDAVTAAPQSLPIYRDCAPHDFVPAPAPTWSGEATAIIDGDSFCMEEVEIRTQRWNAPEWDEEGGPEARAALERLLRQNGPLTCISKARSFDRVIARCTLSDGRELRNAMKEELGE